MFLNLLLLFIPVSLVLEYLVHAPPLFVFATGVLGIVPLADWVRKGTEQIAHRAGSAIGGLLNVTFGNMAELIIAIFILSAGKVQVAKAQITGSIIANALFGLGLAVVAGSFGRERQTFRKEGAGLQSSLLLLCLIALLIPALFDYTERGIFHVANPQHLDMRLSMGVAVVMVLVYIGNLAYTLITHKDVFAIPGGHGPEEHPWPLWKALAVLLGATALIALEAELVSGALEATAHQLGLSEFFLGIIVLAIVGNVSEYIAAVYFARKNQMGLALSITVGATIQVALLTAPALVLISLLVGHPMNLVFTNPLELIAVASVAFIVNAISQDGETTWFEGVLLLAVYALLALAFFYITPGAEPAKA